MLLFAVALAGGGWRGGSPVSQDDYGSEFDYGPAGRLDFSRLPPDAHSRMPGDADSLQDFPIGSFAGSLPPDDASVSGAGASSGGFLGSFKSALARSSSLRQARLFADPSAPVVGSFTPVQSAGHDYLSEAGDVRSISPPAHADYMSNIGGDADAAGFARRHFEMELKVSRMQMKNRTWKCDAV